MSEVRRIPEKEKRRRKEWLAPFASRLAVVGV
jgi:hypothetical protein